MLNNQITVVITAYKSENKIIKCLESIDNISFTKPDPCILLLSIIAIKLSKFNCLANRKLSQVVPS